MVPFTAEQFFGVFDAYHRATWPAQLVLVIAALATISFALRPSRPAGRAVAGLLGLLWLWMGAVYHIAFFAEINRAAFLFGALFVLQGLLFLWVGAVRGLLSFGPRKDACGWIGGLLALYALALYPLLGLLVGHSYPAAPTFGVPCPTVIFTFAVLLWADRPVPRYLLVVPFLWSILGISAAFAFGMVEDSMLVIAGFAGTALILRRNRALRCRNIELKTAHAHELRGA